MNIHIARRLPRLLGIAAIVLLSQATAVHAQALCAPTMTFDECKAKLAPKDTSASAATNAAKITVEKRSTGGDSPSTAATSIENFLPRFAAALKTSDLSADTAALGLNFNLPLNDGVLFGTGVVLSLNVVAHKPQVFAPLTDSIAAPAREAIRKKLEQSLNDYDDAEIAASISVDNGYFGRSFSNYRQRLATLAKTMTAELDQSLRDVVFVEADALNALKIDDSMKDKPECKGFDLGKRQLACFTAATREPYVLQAFQRTTAAQQALTEGSKAIFKSTGFDRIADLVDNQPQLVFTASTRNRRDIVGPSQFGGKAKLEWGFANMNRLMAYCRHELTQECFSSFMNNPAVASSLARGDRITVSVDFTSQPAYGVSLPDTAKLSLPSSSKLTATAGYGSYLGKQPDGTDNGRIDFQFQLINQINDAVRQNQRIAKLTLTEPVSDQGSAIFGVRWANKPEFLGATDGKVRANVGFSYHLMNKADN
jgi:hypothetical protein